MNPEFRATLSSLQRNIESANEAAAENIYTFTQLVIDPCLGGVRSCFSDLTTTCFPSRDTRMRRKRARSRGRSDLHFDFYDDWEEEEQSAPGWGDDELDSLLAGGNQPRTKTAQPGRTRAMSYGTTVRRPGKTPDQDDINVVPQSSYLGFLERFRWRFGGKGVRYKPGAADLQEHPGRTPKRPRHTEPGRLVEEDDETTGMHLNSSRKKKGHLRQRSDTDASNVSKSTTNSLSSRGDLILSDEEDDAVPIDEEFETILSRQASNGNRRPGLSRKSTRAASSKSGGNTVTSKRSNSSETFRQKSRIGYEQHETYTSSVYTSKSIKDGLKDGSVLGQNNNIVVDKDEDLGDQQHVQVDSDASALAGHDGQMVERHQRPRLISPVSSQGYHLDSGTEPFPSLPTTPAGEEEEEEHDAKSS